MASKTDHICVCICTYKRPQLLGNLFKRLQNQKTDGQFTYSIVVVDNDDTKSARDIVTDVREKSLISMDYYVEPEKNIALARNRAVQNANGDFVAFIDDDEFPVNNWLLNLFKTYNNYKADGVLGPVKPYFESEPPQWIMKGKLCERPTHVTGTVMHWNDTRTGNVLLNMNVFGDKKHLFNPEFGTQGEDKDFFRRMIDKGYIFIWCNEAPVYEIVAPDRCNKRYSLRRAFQQGNVSVKYYEEAMTLKHKTYVFVKSTIAIIIYTLILPFTSFFGMHILMRYLIKDIHHISRLLALFKIVVVKERNF